MESFAEIKRSMFAGQMNAAEESGTSAGRLMIIDDNEDILEALTALLRPRFHPISCRSYEEAKNALTADVKVVLLDIKMPSKDGFEVFKLLREERADLRIVFHSAYPGSNESAAAVEHLSHNGYLTKGDYTGSELLAIIEETLHQPADASSSVSVGATSTQDHKGVN